MYTLFAAPPEKDLEWSEEAIEGAWRFLNRVFRLIDKHSVGGAAERQNVKRTEEASRPADYNEKERVLLRKAHQTLKRVTADFETRWHFNSAIAQIMELVNAIYCGGTSRAGSPAGSAAGSPRAGDADAGADDSPPGGGTVGNAGAW